MCKWKYQWSICSLQTPTTGHVHDIKEMSELDKNKYKIYQYKCWWCDFKHVETGNMYTQINFWHGMNEDSFKIIAWYFMTFIRQILLGTLLNFDNFSCKYHTHNTKIAVCIQAFYCSASVLRDLFGLYFSLPSDFLIGISKKGLIKSVKATITGFNIVIFLRYN